MTESIKRQCFAYNEAGLRCDKTPGHRGDHGITLAWADDECYDPSTRITRETTPWGGGMSPFVTTPAINMPGTTTTGELIGVTENGFERRVSTPQASATKCVGCGHAHKGGPCKCECYEFIG